MRGSSWSMIVMFGKYVFVVTPEASHPRQPRERSSAFIPVIVAMGLVVTGVAYSGAVLRNPLLSLFLLRPVASPSLFPCPCYHVTRRERQIEGESFTKCTETLPEYGQSLAVILNVFLDLPVLPVATVSRNFNFSTVWQVPPFIVRTERQEGTSVEQTTSFAPPLR